MVVHITETPAPPSIEAQLLTAIHENGRLADKLNKATTDLAAERGFLANARARADQAERDRDEWRETAEAAIVERDTLAARRSWLDDTEQRASAEREALIVKLANEMAEARESTKQAQAERDEWRRACQALMRVIQKHAEARWRLPATLVAPVACIAFCAALWAVFAATRWWR